MSRKHKGHREQASPVAKSAATPGAQSADDVVGGERTELASRTFAADSENDLNPQAAEAQVAAEWKVGDAILDTYEVKQIYTGGGMGLVYRVYHRDWKEDLAVKSPRPDYYATQDQRENFVRECVTWIGLGLHPHIATCYYVRLLGGIPRVFAEYVAGGTLRDWIEGEDRKLYQGGHEQALERMLDVAIQFARGLHFAHEKGVIHQDIKPANVLITPEGVVKVTDFGLARARAASGESAVAGSQQSMLLSFGGGYTPAYCSPEQTSKQPLTRRTDVWSWGVSVLEMFAGEVFWSSGTTAAASLDTYVEIGAADDAIPRMPDGLVELLRECFRETEAQRPKDMAVIEEHLKTIYGSALGRGYMREEAQVTEATADVLNNQGLSFYNLGMKEEAEKCFEQAVKANPLHREATYNRGLHLWRSGKVTSNDVIGQLINVAKAHPDDPKADYMIGLVHLERGDVGSAERITDSGEKMNASEIGRALMAAKFRDGLGIKWQRLRTFEGHTDDVNSVAISPDGQWGLSGSQDNTLRLWDLAGGQCLHTFEGHTEPVYSVAISPDGRWGLSGSFDNTLRLWDLASGQCLRKFIGHTNSVRSVAISPDGRWGLSGSNDKTLRLWDLASGQCLRAFEGHTDHVTSVAISPDGRWGLSGGGYSTGDNTLRLWDLTSGQCLRTFEGHTGPVNFVAISPNGRWGLSYSSGWRDPLRLWDLASGQCLRTFDSHTDDGTLVAISPDGRRGLSRSGDGTLRLWNLASGQCLHTLEGQHAGFVSSVSINPNGRRAISGSKNHIRLWDLASGQRLRTFDSHTEAVNSVAISPYGRWGLSGSQDNTLRLWDLGRCECLRTFDNHTEAVNSVAISPYRKWGLSGSADKTLRLWHLGRGECLRTFEGHTGNVSSVAISPDGRWGLSGSNDKTLRLWDLAGGQCLRTFDSHTGAVNSVAISPNGRWGLSGSADKTLRLWDLDNGQCLRTFEGHTGNIISVAISPDGRWGLSGSFDNTLRLWDLASGQCLRTFEGHTNSVRSVAISPDGRWGLSGSNDKTLRLWDLAGGQCLRTFEGHTDHVTSVAISSDGRWGSSGSDDKTVRLWDLAVCFRSVMTPTKPQPINELQKQGDLFAEALNAAEAHLQKNELGAALEYVKAARDIHGYERHVKIISVLDRLACYCRRVGIRGTWRLHTFEGHTRSVNSVAICPDGRWAASGSNDSTVRLWDLASGQCLRTFEGHIGPVNSVAISPDGRCGLSGSEDHTLRLWDLASGRCLRTFKGHTRSVNSVAISPDGRWGLSGSWDETLRLWDLASGQCLRTFEGHTVNVTSVAISPNGRWGLVSSTYSFSLWDLASGKRLRKFEEHTAKVNSVAISPDGRWGLSGSDDKTLRLWDLASGQCLRTFEGHTVNVTSVAISPDGCWGLSGSDDKTVRLWDLTSGQCPRTFKGHTELVSSVAISPDGRWGLSGSDDKSFHLWRLDWDYEFPGWADWDERAKPFLSNFLSSHCQAGRYGFSRLREPAWNEERFQVLIKDLQHCGYGWLRPDGVRHELEQMVWNRSLRGRIVNLFSGNRRKK